MGTFVRFNLFFILFLVCWHNPANATGSPCPGNSHTYITTSFKDGGKKVMVEAGKDISHVELFFCDGSYKKFQSDDDDYGQTHTFSYQSKEIKKVAVKSGCTTKYFGRSCNPTPTPTPTPTATATPTATPETFDPACYSPTRANKHFLWLSGTEFVSAGAARFLENEDGTATLAANIIQKNDASKSFDISATFGGRTSIPGPGSPKDAPSGSDTSNWYYYKSVSVVLTGQGGYTGVTVTATNMGPYFQVGEGAGIQSSHFGAAGWLSYVVTSGYKNSFPFPSTGQGDFNWKLEDCPTDCAGDLFGDKSVDSCGVCGGNGPNECGCDLSVIKDSCGVCGGNDSSCKINVCEVQNGNFSDAKVVSIFDFEKDPTTHFSVESCEKITICLKHLQGPTVVVPRIAFDKVYKQEGALLGECQLPACVKSSDGKNASVKFLLESDLSDLITAGEATKDLTQCDKVPVCVGPNLNPPVTKNIPKFVIGYYTSRGFSLGNCTIEDPRPPLCEKTHGQCAVECSQAFDPLWGPTCVPTCLKNCGIYCDKGDNDCIYEKLEPSACAEVNGFLGQVNIATVVNLAPGQLKVEVEYRDLHGNTVSSVTSNLGPNVKQDFIVNELGLEPDTYGTVCVHTDAFTNGMWSGGVTTYKPTEGSSWSDFDFALQYSFKNAEIGFKAAPINTFTLGSSKTANWIRLTDGEKDGNSLMGTLFFFDQAGSLVHLVDVNIPDGGRYDYSGHDALGADTVGNVIFAPKVLPDGSIRSFYFSVGRYFYDCPGENPFACNNFLSAFALPPRTPIRGKVYNMVSNLDDFSVIEFNNPVTTTADVNVKVYDVGGNIRHQQSFSLNTYESYHLIINGILNNGEVGFAVVDSGDDYLTAIATHYRQVATEVINYGYATPFTKKAPQLVQMSEFNSFLGQSNDLELANTSASNTIARVVVLDYEGNAVQNFESSLVPSASIRVPLTLPTDSYGTIIVDGGGIIVRNFVRKPSQYVLPFIGR